MGGWKPATQAIALNRMRDFNEWAQCIVLEVVARYKPDEQQETFDIMNLLEERLKHSNSAVVLAATKVFLNLTQDMPQVHAQVYTRLKAPMLTLMTGGIFEQGFACLKHIALLTQRAPSVFSDDFKHFYCRYNDPACVKLLKLEIITTIATPANVSDIVEELSEYVTDTDNSVARGAVVCEVSHTRASSAEDAARAELRVAFAHDGDFLRAATRRCTAPTCCTASASSSRS